MLIVEKAYGRNSEHERTKKVVLDTFDMLNRKYTLTTDREVNKADLNVYNTVLTLGGDGTFIHTAKYLKNQHIIGVNSNTEKSVGFLLNFDRKNISDLLEKFFACGFCEVDKLSRLGAKINGKNLEHLALNEVLIGDTDIRHTSHLDLKVASMAGYVRGNGVVISTKQGSNAFFKSAQGSPFDVNGIGYALILPYSIDGNLEKSKVCSPEEKFKIIPKRSGYKLAFDCDDTRSFDLLENDEIEIFVDVNNPLNVVRGVRR